MGILQLLIYAIVVAGAIGIALIVARTSGVTVPQWIIQILWIVLAVCVGVLAIRFIAGI